MGAVSAGSVSAGQVHGHRLGPAVPKVCPLRCAASLVHTLKQRWLAAGLAWSGLGALVDWPLSQSLRSIGVRAICAIDRATIAVKVKVTHSASGCLLVSSCWGARHNSASAQKLAKVPAICTVHCTCDTYRVGLLEKSEPEHCAPLQDGKL